MEKHKEKHQPQGQAIESTISQTATEKRQEKKQGGMTDTRKEESRAVQSAKTVDSSQKEVVSTATWTARREPPSQETDSEEEPEGAVAAAIVLAARLDSQIQKDLAEEKKDADAEESHQTDYLDEMIEKMKALQFKDPIRTPMGQHPKESTEGQQASASKTGKEDKPDAVAEASATASGIKEKGKDEEHGSKKKKKKKKKNKRKTDNKEQPDESPILDVRSTKALQNSDQKKDTLHTGYILDRHARNRELSEAAKFFLQSLDEESTESEPSLDARFQSILSGVPIENTMKQLCLNLDCVGITILHGPDGCGKTLTAHFMSNIYRHISTGDVHWYTYSTFPDCLNDQHKNAVLYIIDNFLGHTSFEGFPKWRRVFNILRKSMTINVHVLLVTRTSTLNQALATTGADFADILNSVKIVELSVDYQIIYKHMFFPEAKGTQDFNAIPDIDFPVCFKPASFIPEINCMRLFQNLRPCLHDHVKGLMENTAALLSLGLLAVTEVYVNARELRHPAKLNKSSYLQVLQAMEAGDINEDRVAEIIDFYNETPGLVQVEDDFVSFTNEAVREAVLCVLCEPHAQFLAKHCSLKLLSRLALVTRDPDQCRDDNGKPTLPTSAIEHFLQRLLNEMSLRNYRDTLPSALLEHSSFQRGFKAKVIEKSLINIWLGTNDKNGLHFLFWAGACKTVAKMLVPLKSRRSKEVIWQGVLGSCYWGDTNMLKELLSKLSQDKKNFMLSAKIKDFFEQVKDFNWDESPFHPEDTLLTLAAWRGKDDVVKELVAMKANVNSTGHNDLTALMHYCARGHDQMVKFLLGKGAFIHLQDDIGNTALHYALMGGLQSFHEDLFHRDTMRLPNHRHRTPLIVACGSGTQREVRDKLRRGAEHKELYGSLYFACYKGQTDGVKYLFETENKNHPILNEEDGMDAVQPVINALGSGKPEDIVEILLPKVKSRTDSVQLSRLCTRLCACKDDRAIKELLPVVKSSFDYAFSLMFGCIVKNKTFVEYLLENQPSEENKTTVLLTAACMGSWDFMKWALTNTQMPVTKEVIVHAMKCQQSELVKLLLTSCDTKIDVNPSFFHLAAQHDLLPVMKWLLDDKRMDVDIKDDNGVLPLSVAIESGRERVVKCLVNYGAKITEDIKEDLNKHRATEFKNSRLCKALEKTAQFLVEEESKFADL